MICIPPPNVTGELHMGHALNASIQDLLIRLHRMRGFNTIWQPGYDHAGIATQNVIERELAKEGLTRHDLGREAFVERTWAWLEKYGGVIMGQLRRLGASLDYRRERMTMDEGYVRAVLKWFVHLQERGFLYRANRIVNWCPRCASAISDLEVNHVETDDTLYTIRYPLADGSGHIRIATVRPPTMLADVAVAVHPDDDRYRDLVGKEAVLPIVGRKLPIIEDERVDPEFGTGAVKITPGHDPMDWEIGRDHELAELMVIGLDARMNDEAGEFAGLTQAEANEQIVARLESEGLLESKEPYRHAVATCDRCGSRIEPLVSLQWWCDMSELAKPAIDVVGDGRVALLPRPLQEDLPRLDGGDSALVHLAPALVGPPDSGVVLPGRARDRGRDDSRRLRRVRLGRARRRTRTCSTRGSPRRSGPSRRSAGPTTRPSCAPGIRTMSARPTAGSSSSGRRGCSWPAWS